MTQRKRTPRKTPPGTKPLPRKVTDKVDLAMRQEFLERRMGLERMREQIGAQLVELEGERKFWRRTVINPKYQMTDADMIESDGTIERVG